MQKDLYSTINDPLVRIKNEIPPPPEGGGLISQKNNNEFNELEEAINLLKEELDAFKNNHSSELTSFVSQTNENIHRLSAHVKRIDEMQIHLMIDINKLKEALPKVSSQVGLCLQQLANKEDKK